MRGIGVVLEYTLDTRVAIQRERRERGFERVGRRLCVNLLALHVHGEGAQVFRFLVRVVDGLPRPVIERVRSRPDFLGFPDVIGECVELAFQFRAMLFQHVMERRVRLRSGIGAPRASAFFRSGDPDLELPCVLHGFPESGDAAILANG